jgi:hypothetical protein
MNEKVKAELARQLSEGLHFFVHCTNCDERFAAEVPITECLLCESKQLESDLADARTHYRALIEQAFQYGGSESDDDTLERAARLVEERGRKIGGAIDPKRTAAEIRALKGTT